MLIRKEVRIKHNQQMTDDHGVEGTTPKRMPKKATLGKQEGSRHPHPNDQDWHPRRALIQTVMGAKGREASQEELEEAREGGPEHSKPEDVQGKVKSEGEEGKEEKDVAEKKGEKITTGGGQNCQ